MTKRPSDVLARMKATATREKPVSIDPSETTLRPEVLMTEDTPPTKPPAYAACASPSTSTQSSTRPSSGLRWRLTPTPAK
ncbi:hypothetical protein [Deinococcus wulumuqiensis]|uniref:hypothetical protein n=1 Tax=Deinococcus wulumuqiensis TaxID=980427 RepID=UPI0013C3006A|nr:hypothetical protein [Deinococcus wulumuqiensis]